MQYSFKKVHRI
nr:unnamed protein product [Callosobruchus analis]